MEDEEKPGKCKYGRDIRVGFIFENFNFGFISVIFDIYKRNFEVYKR